MASNEELRTDVKSSASDKKEAMDWTILTLLGNGMGESIHSWLFVSYISRDYIDMRHVERQLKKVKKLHYLVLSGTFSCLLGKAK